MAIIAEKYDQLQYSRQGENGIELIDKVAVKKGSYVLDLGCGTGFLTSILAERVGVEGKVVGIDPNGARLNIAREKYKAQNNLVFVNGSSEDIPSGPYDVIFSNLVMHWIEDKESTFRNVCDNLRVGGKFAFLCGGKNSHGWWDLTNTIAKQPLHLAPSEDYESIAQRCGFEVEFKSADAARYTFASMDEYMEWIIASMNVDADTIEPGIMHNLEEAMGAVPEMEYIKIIFVLKKVL